MNKIKLFFLTIFSAVLLNGFAQNHSQIFDFQQRPEAYFRFQIEQPKEIATLTQVISIDKVEGNTVFAYANEREFQRFLEMGYSVDIQTPPSMLEHALMKDFEEIQASRDDWNYYPTYEAYVSMMNQFASDYPNLCQTVNIGTTVQNRALLVCKISANVDVQEAEPQVFYSSSMHGDEVTGYVLMLRLIDHLLSNYGSNTEITALLDQYEIWICPLANPDGTYRTGNQSVNGATRSNALGVDLNRNYKDFVFGDHPDGEAWQPETEAFMAFQAQHQFVLGVNIHGGAAVVNYVWDNKSAAHADQSWWEFVCREYADTVHAHASGNYMTYLNNGITNGFAWYTITGSRQDYTNYYDHTREITLEISDDKTPSAGQLPNFWNYNYRSFINFIKQAGYGFRGIITDCETQQPIAAKVFIEDHDKDHSEVYSNAQNGDYYRPIKGGTYTITYSAYGYHPQTVSLTVNDRQSVIQNIELCPADLIADFEADKTQVAANEPIQFTDLSFGDPETWQWLFLGGNPMVSNEQNPTVVYPIEGDYDVQLIVSKTIDGELVTDTIVRYNYINIANQYLMQNGTFTTCNGLFLDDGGLDGNYSDRKNYQMTFLPQRQNAHLTVSFTSFSLENNYDFLKIYDAATNSSSSLIGSYTGNSLPPTITATNAEGALTFVFTSDYAMNDAGWVATISCDGESEAPVADFMADNTEIFEGNCVTFSDLSTGEPTEWSWYFEGGTPSTSTEQNPIVTYNNAGTFDVYLYVTNENGGSTASKMDFVVVHVAGTAPTADFTADNTEILVGDSVTFTDLSTDSPTAWSWIFEGGTPATSTEENPTVVYDAAGTYDVTLTVTNEFGSDTKTQTQFITVSTSDNIVENIDNQWFISPNPTSGKTIISSAETMQKVEIHDIYGRLLKVILSEEHSIELNTNELPSGIYFVSVVINQKVSTQRLMVVR